MVEGTQLLLIDFQNDFCDPKKGSLYVPNSENDVKRASKFINKFGEKIEKIHVSMDCHHLISIFHPLMWINNGGNNPSPFTIITSKDIKEKTWSPIYPLEERFISYCEKLEEKGKYKLTIWPEHCLISSWGSNIVPTLYKTLLNWERKNLNIVNYILKGSSIFTENYSIFESEVPDEKDITTQLNINLINKLFEGEQIIILGEAGSHCVKSSIESLINNLPKEEDISKITVLEDCISTVSGFEEIQKQFLEDIKQKGVKIAKTTDF